MSKKRRKILHYSFDGEDIEKILLDHVLNKPEVKGAKALKMDVKMVMIRWDRDTCITFKLTPESLP